MNSTNPFIYSDDNKRYHTLNYYNKSSFNSKVFKAVIDAGFTCPNKDGTKGTGGCIYCMGGSGVKSNMVYTLCKHMVYMLSITNEHKK